MTCIRAPIAEWFARCWMWHRYDRWDWQHLDVMVWDAIADRTAIHVRWRS